MPSTLERIQAELREIGERVGQMQPSAAVSSSPDRATVVEEPSRVSTWQQAVAMANVREARKREGLDCSITAIANAAGCSRGRVSELLAIRDAFDAEGVSWVGLADSRKGEELLSRLSYRELRSILRQRSRLSRVVAIWRLTSDKPVTPVSA
jgi:hypothetical protein